MLLHSEQAEFFCSHTAMRTIGSCLETQKSWGRLSTLGGRPPSTLGGLARHIFVILLAFSSGWTSAALCKAYGAGIRRLLLYALLRWRLHPQTTPTPHPWRPNVPMRPCQCVRCFRMGIGPALVGLRGQTAIAVRTRCCVCRARVQFTGLAWLDGRPACRGALVTQGSPQCGKFAITVRFPY